MGITNSIENRNVPSINKKSWTWKNGDESVVKLMLPVYYSTGTLVPAEVVLAKKSWDYIANDMSPIYVSNLYDKAFASSHPTCRDWFSDVFYERLFDVHPLCKPMFKSAMSKGSFIHGLLSFLFTVLEHKKAFHQRLLQIANSHVKKGVKAVEYGIIGECMFWALEVVLGKNIYTEHVHTSWVKIFSAMLRVIVPVAVAHELASNEAQRNRIMDHQLAFGYSPSNKNAYVPTKMMDVCPIMAPASQDTKNLLVSTPRTDTNDNSSVIRPATTTTTTTTTTATNPSGKATSDKRNSNNNNNNNNSILNTLISTVTAATSSKTIAKKNDNNSTTTTSNSTTFDTAMSELIADTEGGKEGSEFTLKDHEIPGIENGISMASVKDFMVAQASRRKLIDAAQPYTSQPIV